VRHIFLGWKSTSIGGYTGTGNPGEVLINNDIVETAEWKTQYYLTITQNDGGTLSPASGWYDAGTEVTITSKPNLNYSFDQWVGTGLGSYSGSEFSDKIVMNNPVKEEGIFLPFLSDLKIYVKDIDGNPMIYVTIISTIQPMGQNSIFGITDSNGSLTFNIIRSGSYTFSVSKNGYLTKSEYITVNAGKNTEFTSTIEKEYGILNISVKTTDGNPINEVTITSLSQPLGEKGISGITSSDGFLVFNKILTGDYVIQATKKGYISKSLSVNIETLKTSEITFNLQQEQVIPGFPIESLIFGIILILLYLVHGVNVSRKAKGSILL